MLNGKDKNIELDFPRCYILQCVIYIAIYVI